MPKGSFKSPEEEKAQYVRQLLTDFYKKYSPEKERTVLPKLLAMPIDEQCKQYGEICKKYKRIPEPYVLNDEQLNDLLEEFPLWKPRYEARKGGKELYFDSDSGTQMYRWNFWNKDGKGNWHKTHKDDGGNSWTGFYKGDCCYHEEWRGKSFGEGKKGFGKEYGAFNWNGAA